MIEPIAEITSNAEQSNFSSTDTTKKVKDMQKQVSECGVSSQIDRPDQVSHKRIPRIYTRIQYV